MSTSLLLAAGAATVASAQRTLTFVNNCANDAQLLATAGANSDGSYLANPDPTNGYTITANGGTTAITYQNNGDFYWSGNHRFYMGDASACTTPEAGGPYAGCSFVGPATETEYTFVTDPSGVDVYDISNINGINVPVSIAPVNPQPVDGDDYSCGTAGTNSGDSWTFSPPSDNYNWVDAAGDACTATSDCASGVCGFAFTAGVGLSQGCGNLLGYWTVDEICPLDTGNIAFDCSSALTVGSKATTLGNLSGCNDNTPADIGSCYQTSATDDNCCGCVNWQDTISSVPASTGTCVASSQTWTDNILPTLQWIKQGAPSTYTYPYDDISSTFTCAPGDYTITLCPEGTSLFA